MPGRGAAAGITYAHDALGRLAAVIDTSITSGTNAAVYNYDAVGNLTKITNNSATTVAIFTFTPNNGPVGQTVTIYGDGFSTTPSQNTVTFYNGITATVMASTLATTATVPSSATSGPIKVTVGGNSATSTTDFTVTAN